MRAVLVACLLSLSAQVATQQALEPVLDFAGPDTAQKWQAVNDGVMAGVSDGRYRITAEKTLEFSGTLSLENNGGFASVRTKPTELDIRAGDTIVLRVKGDGREYVLNFYTKSRRMAFSYRARTPMIRQPSGDRPDIGSPRLRRSAMARMTIAMPTPFGSPRLAGRSSE